MKRFFSSVALLFAVSGTALADTNALDASNVETIKCPVLGADYTQLLAKLSTLKASIKQDANCIGVGNSISSHFNDVLKNRDHFLELVKKAESGPLSDKDILDITNYIDSTTENAAMLVDLLQGNTQCFQGDSQKEGLASLSGLIGEATTLLTEIAGPWGPAISLGGHVLAGFITTVDRIIKDQAGYDFRDRTQWMSYVQSVCTYQSLRHDIDDLLHPQQSIYKLQSINGKLTQSLRILSSMSQTDARVATLNTEVATAQRWIAKRIDQIQKDANGDWNNVTGKEVLSQADQEMNNFLIEKQAPKFLAYQIQSTNRDFADLAEYAFDEGQSLLHEAFVAGFIDSEPPADTGVPNLGLGMPYPATDGSAVFNALTQMDWHSRYQNLRRADDDLEYRLMNARKQAQNKFDTAAWAYGVAYVFCDFFGQADLYTNDIRANCTSRNFKNDGDTVNHMLGANPVRPQWMGGSQSANVIRGASWSDALDLWTQRVSGTLPQLH